MKRTPNVSGVPSSPIPKMIGITVVAMVAGVFVFNICEEVSAHDLRLIVGAVASLIVWFLFDCILES